MTIKEVVLELERIITTGTRQEGSLSLEAELASRLVRRLKVEGITVLYYQR